MNYSELLQAFIDYQRSLFHTEKTIAGYTDILNNFFKFCKNLKIDEFKVDIFLKYQLELVNRGLKSASVDSYLRHIKAFVHWLGENDYIENKSLYQSIKLPKLSKKNVKIYSPEEISDIYAAVSSSPAWINLRDKLIISLMYDSGLRQAEVCKIALKDIDFKNMLLHVHGKGNKDRIVPIGNITLKYINMYLKDCPFKSDMLLVDRRGSPLSGNAVKLFIQKIKNSIGFEFSSHKLRHNFATNYLIDQYEKYGYFDCYSLMILLGHEDISTTDRYLHLAKQYIASKQRISHLDSIFGKNGV